MLKFIIGLLFVTLTCTFVQNMYFVYVIENRCKDLGLMKYSGKGDIWVGKDSMIINDTDIHYLKYGNYEDYKSKIK